MDANSFIALTLWVMANLAVAKMRMKGYEKIVAYLVLLVLMMFFVPYWAPVGSEGEAYIVTAVVPLVLLVGEFATKAKRYS